MRYDPDVGVSSLLSSFIGKSSETFHNATEIINIIILNTPKSNMDVLIAFLFKDGMQP